MNGISFSSSTLTCTGGSSAFLAPFFMLLARLPSLDPFLSAIVLPEVEESVEVELFDISRLLYLVPAESDENLFDISLCFSY